MIVQDFIGRNNSSQRSKDNEAKGPDFLGFLINKECPEHRPSQSAPTEGRWSDAGQPQDVGVHPPKVM